MGLSIRDKPVEVGEGLVRYVQDLVRYVKYFGFYSEPWETNERF